MESTDTFYAFLSFNICRKSSRSGFCYISNKHHLPEVGRGHNKGENGQKRRRLKAAKRIGQANRMCLQADTRGARFEVRAVETDVQGRCREGLGANLEKDIRDRNGLVRSAYVYVRIRMPMQVWRRKQKRDAESVTSLAIKVIAPTK